MANVAVTSSFTVLAMPSLLPEPYYLDLPCSSESPAGLQRTLGSISISKPYQENVFDCSNMAGYLQWRLKSQGYDAKICGSMQFQDGENRSGAHAWVAVDLGGVRYYIDSVDPALPIIGPKNKRYNNFNSPERVYSSIYEIEPEYICAFGWWGPGQLDYSLEATRVSSGRQWS